MEKPKWMEDESVRHIEPKKLEFLSSLVENGRGKSQKEMMNFFLSKMKYAKANHIDFNSSEIALVIAAIKKYSTPEELKNIEEIMKKAPK
ncbi:MAG: hypothetical protein ACI4EX_03835 [Lachnospiraceae bacterium]